MSSHSAQTDHSILFPDYQLCLAYARAKQAAGLRALFIIDSHLGRVAYGARDPMIGRIKLAWWREQGFGPAAERTELAEFIAQLQDLDPNFAERLIGLADAWDALVGAEQDAVEDLARSCEIRGEALFAAALQLSGHQAGAEGLRIAQAWAITDYGRRTGRADLLTQARARFQSVSLSRLAADLKALAVLAALARDDSERGIRHMSSYGSPTRIFTALKFALFKK